MTGVLCTVKLADIPVRIYTQYPEVAWFFTAYRTEEPPVFEIRTEPEDREYERKASRSIDLATGHSAPIYPDAYLETVAILRKLAEVLPRWNVLLFHGSAVALDGEAYLFAAPSGTGKSTHTRLWREHFGNRAVMINDDKPFLRVTDRGVLTYGSPWDGKHRLSANLSVPLKAICFLEQGTENQIRSAGKREVYHLLLRQMYRTSTPEGLTKTMQLADAIADSVRLYQLTCNMQPEAALVSYEGMRE